MATRTTRSKKVKPAEDQDRGFMAAFRDLGMEKGINPEILFDAIEAALVAAYKRNFNAAQNVRVTLDRTSGQYHVYAIKTVVEEVVDNVQEISLAMAQQISPNYQLDDTLEVEVTPANFGRIAAQTAKQVVVQRIREAERGIIYEEFSSREGDIVTGLVQRVENRNVYVDLGKTEAIMPLGAKVIQVIQIAKYFHENLCIFFPARKQEILPERIPNESRRIVATVVSQVTHPLPNNCNNCYSCNSKVSL